MDSGFSLLEAWWSMSEYQYYEFRAVDRPLTKREMGELRALSTRAAITSTSFVNTYEWGDFKGDPDALMARYFDAFIYVANWGIRRLTLRFPRRMVDEKALSAYCRGESARMRKTPEFIIVNFWQEDESPEWEEDDEGWMAALIPLREEVLRGDLRCLYLGWLLGVQKGEFKDDDAEPMVPGGLAKLSAPLEAFADFLGIDQDLIVVASEQSSLPKAGPARGHLEAWIESMPEKEKNALLLEAACVDHPHFRVDLLRRFEQSRRSPKRDGVRTEPVRTVGELLAAAKARAAERSRAMAERAVSECARQEHERATARAKYLDQLAAREYEVWEQVTQLIQTKQPNNYDRAVSCLVDLRDLASRRGREQEFKAALDRLRECHLKKESFLFRLEKVQL